MHCPTCGAEIQKAEQRYCHECGASLPEQSPLPTTKAHGPSRQVATRDQPRSARQSLSRQHVGETRPQAHELLAGVMPNTIQNRVIVGGVVAVLAIFAVWMLVNWIVDTMIHVVLPIAVLLAVIYVGFRYVQSRRTV